MDILNSDCFKEHEDSAGADVDVDESGEVVRPVPVDVNGREYLRAQLEMIMRLKDDVNQEPTLPPLADPSNELIGVGEIIATNFESFLRTRRTTFDGVVIPSSQYYSLLGSRMIACMAELHLKSRERGSTDLELKSKSLMSRWYGCKSDVAISTTAAANDDGGGNGRMQLARDILFRHRIAPNRNAVVYRITCVFTRYGKKLLPIDTASASKDTVVHAQRLECDSFGSVARYYLPEYGPGANAINPFFIVLKGNEIRDFIGMMSLRHLSS